MNLCTKNPTSLPKIKSFFYNIVHLYAGSLRSADKVGRPFWLFIFCLLLLLLFISLSYFSLAPLAFLDFSVISLPISIKFDMVIVRNETNSTG